MGDDRRRRQVAQHIESKRTGRGGWTRETLAAWGVRWPPRPGWRRELIEYGSLERIDGRDVIVLRKPGEKPRMPLPKPKPPRKRKRYERREPRHLPVMPWTPTPEDRVIIEECDRRKHEAEYGHQENGR